MTKLEAEALAARLCHIWGIKEKPVWDILDTILSIKCELEKGLLLDFLVVFDVWVYVCQLKYFVDGRLQSGWLYYETYSSPHGQVRIVDSEGEAVEDSGAFARTWMNIFRRNCFLMGCPIEATAHEKMEWMQGFSREEIEAWNLKI